MLTRNVSSVLRPISSTYRRRIRARYHGPTTLNKQARIDLAQAIFEVENDAEQKWGTVHPQGQTMNSVRNLLLDDARENEPLPGRYPQHEAVARIIARKRKARPNAAEALRRYRDAQAAAVEELDT